MSRPASSADTDGTGRLWIVGASTRAAAESALRAGLIPYCSDLFADADLRRIAQVHPVGDYARDLPRISATLPMMPWLYTGGLENRPDLVDQMARQRPLWGNAGMSLRRARDPAFVATLLAAAGRPTLQVRPEANPPVADASWMLKPLAGAGGRGVRVWDAQTANELPGREPEPHYFQQRRDGTPISALYCACPGAVQLIGIARQLIGVAEVHAAEFAFCGALAPWTLPPQQVAELQTIGEIIGTGCGLRGLFGCDFLLDDRGAWLTEVNPRYTASVELFEYALGLPCLDWHRRACETGENGQGEAQSVGQELKAALAERKRSVSGRIFGKLILYAAAAGTAPDLERCAGSRESLWEAPELADIPPAGSRIEAGQPVCTFLASAPSAAECERKMFRKARRIGEILSAGVGSPGEPIE